MRAASIALSVLLILPDLCTAAPPRCDAMNPHDAAMAGKAWLTTAVHVDGDRRVDVSRQYPAVVGISVWDPCRNRFEYFDPVTGASRAAQGGSGHFLFTSEGRYQITLPDHAAPIQRRIEVLTGREFTYSRQVPEGMKPGAPMRVIHVVHTPYDGPLQIPEVPRSAPE